MYVVASNRDEYLDRPAVSAHFWPEEGTFAGKDLLVKGTWLGISPKTGKFGVLTNKSEKLKQYESETIKAYKNNVLLSRGRLIPSFIQTETVDEEENFWQNLKNEDFDGFNVLFGTPDSLLYFHDLMQEPQVLEDGVYGLNNAYLNTEWKKLVNGKRDFERIVKSHCE